MKTLGRTLMAVALGLVVVGPLQAQIGVIVDETGNGTIDLFQHGSAPLTCAPTLDPGPGGLINGLFCELFLFPNLTFGDLLIHDADGSLSDVIRFEQLGITGPFGFFFYSLVGPDLADTGLPSLFQANVANVTETNIGVFRGAFYTPQAGQPGFTSGIQGYTVTSAEEATVAPEPATLVLMATGLIGMAGFVRRRRAA
jgi:hypothetical protein